MQRRSEQYVNQQNKRRHKLVFSPGDLVWVHLRKERFPSRRRTKLDPRGDGPFKILEAYGDNAYKVELPDTYGAHPTFNVADLTPYVVPQYDDGETGTFHIQGGESDETLPSMSAQEEVDAMTVRSTGPITRARAKAIAQATHSMVIRLTRHPEKPDDTSLKELHMSTLQLSPVESTSSPIESTKTKPLQKLTASSGRVDQPGGRVDRPMLLP